MVYFDTSFLAPLVLPESNSEKVAAFVRAMQDRPFAVSHWTRVEFSSLLAREVRMGGLDALAAGQADARFDAMLGASFVVILPMSDDFSLARRYFGMFDTGLRAGDALHLAIATNHGAQAFFTLDKALLKAGNRLGLPVSMGISAD